MSCMPASGFAQKVPKCARVAAFGCQCRLQYGQDGRTNDYVGKAPASARSCCYRRLCRLMHLFGEKLVIY